MAKLMEGFAQYLSLERQLENKTVENKVRLAKFILHYCPHLELNEINGLFYRLKTQGKSASYLNLLTSAVKDYCHYLEVKGSKVDPEIYTLKWFKPDEAVRSIFTTEETKTFLSYPFHTLSWKVFWHVLAGVGARPSEIARLTVEDVFLGNRQLFIRKTKTGRPRTLKIPVNLLPMLGALLKQKKTGKLFPTVNEKTWGYHYRRIVKKLGLEKRPGLTVYSFRRRHLSALAKNNISIFKIKYIAGHRHIKSTEPYILLNMEEEIESALYSDPLNRDSADPKIIIENLQNTFENMHLENNPYLDFFMQKTVNHLVIKVGVKSVPKGLKTTPLKQLIRVGN